MKTVIFDTNALVSFVTDRNPSQQELVARILEDASRLKCSVTCPQQVLTEFAFVMDRVYAVPKKDIAAMVTDLAALPGVAIRHDLDLSRLFALWPDIVPDFGDAVVATVCAATKGAEVMTFDERFQKALLRAGLAVYPTRVR